MKYGLVFTMIIAAVFVIVQPASAGDHRLGMGVHYWDTVDNIDIEDYDDSGYSWLVSYQYKPSLVGYEFDVEFADDQPGNPDKWTYSPQAFVLIGGTIYGGVGAGLHYADGESSDPFYALKAGVDFELLPYIHMDINANYRFENWDVDAVEEDVDTDTVTLGAVVRFEF